MRYLSDIIADIRMEVVDEAESRWSDVQVLRAMAWSIRRLAHVLRKNDIEPGRVVATITTIPGQQSYTLPSDYMAPSGLYRDATQARVTLVSEDQWAQLNAPGECAAWLKRGASLLLAAVPSTVETLTLVYWPIPNTADMAVDDLAPWQGRFDDVITQYAALRLKNMDEMNAVFDVQMLQDIENNLIATYAQNNPTVESRRGWLV